MKYIVWFLLLSCAVLRCNRLVADDRAQTARSLRAQSTRTDLLGPSAALTASAAQEATVDDTSDDFQASRWTDRWTITADALFLDRRSPTSTILVANTVDPTQFLNASSFNFPVQAGWDLGLGRRVTEVFGVEVRYFGVDQWATTSSIATTPGDQLVVNAAIPVFTLSGTSVDARTSSRLHNVEFNGRRQIGESLTILAGFRYLELNENLGIQVNDSQVPFDYRMFTRNHLYGAQVGGDLTLWDRGGPLRITGLAKAGLFGNQAAQDSAYSTNLVTLTSAGSKANAAFLGEVALNASLQLADHWAARAGYRVLWVDGVALATDQVAASDFVFGHGLQAAGDTMYHGAFVGLEYAR